MRRERGTGAVSPIRGGWGARLPGRYGRERIGVYPTEEAAELALAAHLRELAHEPDPSALTIDAWGQQWLDARAAKGDHSSVRKERTRWDCRIAGTEVGDLPLEDATPVDIRAWLAGLRLRDGREPSYSVRRNCLTLLRSALKAAVDAGLLHADPTAGVRLPRGAAKGTADRWAWLRTDEVEALLTAMQAHSTTRLRPRSPGFSLQWRSMIVAAVYTGLRAGELHALPWRCVDLEAGLVRVEQTRDQPNGAGTVRTISQSTKSGHAREVPLMAPAVAVLREWRDEYQRRGIRSHHDLVWPSADGGPRSEGYDAMLPRALKLAGIARRSHFHDLRHTCASHLVQGTWAPELVLEPLRLEEVRQWLGHGSIAMVQRYAHMDPKGLRRLAVVPTVERHPP